MEFLDTAAGIVTDVDGLTGYVGRHLGYTDWEAIDQDRVDRFADATDDHQFIHVDPARARATGLPGTIAHGFLTLALIAPVLERLLVVSDRSSALNYGLDRVRFPAPLPVGARWRGGVEVVEVTPVDGGLQLRLQVTIEAEHSEKPVLVADFLTRQYR
jgi:acyl dehydratase